MNGEYFSNGQFWIFKTLLEIFYNEFFATQRTCGRRKLKKLFKRVPWMMPKRCLRDFSYTFYIQRIDNLRIIIYKLFLFLLPFTWFRISNQRNLSSTFWSARATQINVGPTFLYLFSLQYVSFTRFMS